MRDKEQRKYVGFLPANEEATSPFTTPALQQKKK